VTVAIRRKREDSMTRIHALLFLSTVLGLSMPQAQEAASAQTARSFVSSFGNDANDCSRSAPCRTFQGAHDKTFDQGEITVLDPGGYGAVTITKSISIVNDGVGEAGLLVSGGVTGIVINAANAYVNLRGLTIQGIGFGGGNGIRLDNGFSLTISNCVIRNLTGEGIDFLPATDARLSISTTLVADNGGNGIAVLPPGGSGVVKVDISRVDVHDNLAGFVIATSNSTGPLAATIADSVSAANRYGVSVGSGSGPVPATVMVVRSVVSNSTALGLVTVGHALIAIGQSAVIGNATTWAVGSNGGVGGVLSFGDNYIFGNGDGDPAPPVLAKK
jgi:hypothetical protein